MRKWFVMIPEPIMYYMSPVDASIVVLKNTGSIRKIPRSLVHCLRKPAMHEGSEASWASRLTLTQPSMSITTEWLYFTIFFQLSNCSLHSLKSFDHHLRHFSDEFPSPVQTYTLSLVKDKGSFCSFLPAWLFMLAVAESSCSSSSSSGATHHRRWPLVLVW